MSQYMPGDRVVAMWTGNAGTILGCRRVDGEFRYDVEYDNGERRESVPGRILEPGRPRDEESMTKTTEERLESLENNVADHEQAIGDNDGQVSLVEQLDIAYGHFRRDAARIETLESAVKSAEVHLESNERRLEEVANKTAQRFERVEIRANGIASRVAAIESHRALSTRVEEIAEQLASLAGKFERHKALSIQLSNGPKSYDKRIGALEECLSRLVDRVEKSVDIDVLANHRLDRLAAAVGERRTANEDRLNGFERRISILENPPSVNFYGAVEYSGTGDDAIDDDYEITPEEQRSIDQHVADEMQRARLAREAAFIAGESDFTRVDPASRDVNASERAIKAALSDVLTVQYEPLIEASVDRQTARNCVDLRATDLLTELSRLAWDVTRKLAGEESESR